MSNRGGGRDLWQQRLTTTGVADGEPERVTAGVGMWRATLSPDGTRLAYVQGGRTSNVWRVPILADRLTTWADAEQLTFDRAHIQGIDVSPDGSRLVVNSDCSGNMDLWVLPADGGDLQRLTSHPTPDWFPRWSPDGQNIAFYAYRSGSRDIWVIPSDGGLPRQLTSEDGVESRPDWSPDGTEIVYRSIQNPGGSALWIVSVESGVRRPLIESGNEPLWSPVGHWVAFERDQQIWRVPSAGGEAELLTRGTRPRWSSDGSQIYFLRDFRSTAWVLSLGERTERQLMDLSDKPGRIDFSAVAPHGRYLYFTWREDQGDIWVMDVVQDGP